MGQCILLYFIVSCILLYSTYMNSQNYLQFFRIFTDFEKDEKMEDFSETFLCATVFRNFSL